MTTNGKLRRMGNESSGMYVSCMVESSEQLIFTPLGAHVSSRHACAVHNAMHYNT